ncbi:MAG: hypothetical protein AAFV07_03350, partial [Bacteroidota bacterium]
MWKKIVFWLALAAFVVGGKSVQAQTPTISEVMILPPEPACGAYSRVGVIVSSPGTGPFTVFLRRS